MWNQIRADFHKSGQDLSNSDVSLSIPEDDLFATLLFVTSKFLCFAGGHPQYSQMTLLESEMNSGHHSQARQWPRGTRRTSRWARRMAIAAALDMFTEVRSRSK